MKADKRYTPVVGGRVVQLGKVSGQDAYEAVSKIVPHATFPGRNLPRLQALMPHYRRTLPLRAQARFRLQVLSD